MAYSARDRRRASPPRGLRKLREQDRRQPPAALDRGLVGRTPGLEKLHELLSRAVVVPFTVALDDADQLLQRVEPLALAVERQRKIEPRLMVERIGGDFLLQLGYRPEILCLFGKLERRAGGKDRRIVPLGFGNQRQRLLGLLGGAGFDIASRQSGEGLDVAIVFG